ncbi:hypothetical protein ACHQM5_008899 [Ranunculus cassubicifolius]
MGRGKVELKRIENRINRQVTFAKRRNGLLKKACELSILCDAEVALIIFSNRGKLYEFSSSSSMLKVLERYQRTTASANYAALEADPSDIDTQHATYQEYLKLKTKIEFLHRNQRNLQGDDLDQLSVRELDQLEHQLDSALRRVRSAKTDTMLSTLAGLQSQEHMLREHNKILRKRLDEITSKKLVKQQHPREETFFQPLEHNSPTLQLGYNPAGGYALNYQWQMQNGNGFIPGWMH